MKYYAVEYKGQSLSHHGVKGMKWGIRKKQASSSSSTRSKSKSSSSSTSKTKAAYKSAKLEYDVNKQVDKELKKQRRKKIALGVAGAAALAGVSYGVYRHYKNKNAGANLSKLAKEVSTNTSGTTKLPALPISNTSAKKSSSAYLDIIKSATASGKKNKSVIDQLNDTTANLIKKKKR